MTIAFNKYHGTGNDFIIIDNRNRVLNPPVSALIRKLCDRRFGIGADGLIIISEHEGYDFEMAYYNADGQESSMCGNGGRCAVDFAIRSGISGKKLTFMAADGPHQSEYDNGIIRLRLNDVSGSDIINGNHFINTGSPHYVVFTEDPDLINVSSEGKRLRWSPDFPEGGTNVNFAGIENNGLYVRTFERGVEDETLSCGTGVTASAIAAVLSGHFVSGPVNVRTRGGNLKVEFDGNSDLITNIWLCGPATFVFEGQIKI